MPFSLTEIGCGFLLPAVAAAVVTWLLARALMQPTAALFGFVVGFQAGYWSLQLAPWIPESHWQWLPYILLFASGTVLLPDRHRVGFVLRWIFVLIVSGTAAWLLVPTWTDLPLSQTTYAAIFSGAVLADTVALRASSNTSAHRAVLSYHVANALTISIVLMISGSARFALLGGCGAAAMAGLLLAALFKVAFDLDCLAFPYALFAVGTMLIGQVNSFSSVPVASYAICALMPCLVWACVRPGVSARPRTLRWLIRGLPFVFCLIAVGMAVFAEFGATLAESW
jgi:hypothetical protein